MTTVEKTRNMIDVISRLNDLLERENASLKSMQVGAIKDLNDEKQRLARLYEQLGADLAEAREEIQAMPDALTAPLREAGIRLETLTRENAIRLKAAMTANQKLFDIVRTAIDNQNKQGSVYTKTGATAADRPESAKPIAMTLNETL